MMNKSKLDNARAQRLNERGSELQDGIANTLSRPARYAGQEVRSRYTYPKEYKGPKPIADQIKAIAKIFDLDPRRALEFAKNLSALPEGAEGWFAIPSDEGIRKLFSEVTDSTERYYASVRLVYEKVGASRLFFNHHLSFLYRDGITPAHLRVHARTAHALDLIAKTQKGDILIVAAQLGMRHRGRSVHRAREVFVANEFGLGSLAVGSIVLTHPERLVRWEELDMGCSGDEFVPAAGGDFSNVPYFGFDVEVELSIMWFNVTLPKYGAVTGFLM